MHVRFYSRVCRQWRAQHHTTTLETTNPSPPHQQVKAMQYTSCAAGVPPVNDQRNLMTLEDSGEVVFTYDVEWVEDPHTVWAHRWDVYLK